jgi:hypothetical protein
MAGQENDRFPEYRELSRNTDQVNLRVEWRNDLARRRRHGDPIPIGGNFVCELSPFFEKSPSA